MEGEKVPVLVALLLLSSCLAAETLQPTPDWATPEQGPMLQSAHSKAVTTLPGSDLSLTQAQIDDPFNTPDWYPDEHEPMPRIVKHGNAPGVFACAMCHLASGNGHPQSGKLAGLTAEYIRRQLEAFKNGDRQSYLGDFIDNLHSLKDERNVELAADWFASLPVRRFQKVTETAKVPKTRFTPSFMRVVKNDKSGDVQMEPLDGRIIEVPESYADAKARNPKAKFLTYVPVGSIEKGRAIVTNGIGTVAPCGTCHGPALKGTTIAPSIAGSFPTYIVRQLYDFRNGKRRGLADSTRYMSTASPQLSEEDVINIAAYVGSLSP